MIKACNCHPNPIAAHDDASGETWDLAELVDHANGCEEQIDFLLSVIEARDQELEIRRKNGAAVDALFPHGYDEMFRTVLMAKQMAAELADLEGVVAKLLVTGALDQWGNPKAA